MVAPILDKREVILGSINILIYAFCFSAFITNVKNEADFGIAFFFIACLMVPILQVIAGLLIFIGTVILEIIVAICSYMVEFNIELEAKLFGYKGFDNYTYNETHYKEHKDKTENYQQSCGSKQEDNQKQSHGQKQERNEYSRQGNDSDEEKARRIFGLYGEFTVNGLKAVRRSLMKKNHPDQGGSEERAREINAAYDILLPLAKNKNDPSENLLNR